MSDITPQPAPAKKPAFTFYVSEKHLAAQDAARAAGGGTSRSYVKGIRFSEVTRYGVPAMMGQRFDDLRRIGDGEADDITRD